MPLSIGTRYYISHVNLQATSTRFTSYLTNPLQFHTVPSKPSTSSSKPLSPFSEMTSGDVDAVFAPIPLPHSSRAVFSESLLFILLLLADQRSVASSRPIQLHISAQEQSRKMFLCSRLVGRRVQWDGYNAVSSRLLLFLAKRRAVM